MVNADLVVMASIETFKETGRAEFLKLCDLHHAFLNVEMIHELDQLPDVSPVKFTRKQQRVVMISICAGRMR